MEWNLISCDGFFRFIDQKKNIIIKISAVTLFAKERNKESKILLRQQAPDFIMWNIHAFKENSNMYTFPPKNTTKRYPTCQRTKFSLITFRTASLLHTSLFNCWHGNSCTSWTFTKSHLLCSWPSILAWENKTKCCTTGLVYKMPFWFW